jgi:hypothetical protein
VADEDLVLDLDALADERVALNLAAPPDHGSFLDLDERSDLRLVADFTAVEIDELGELHIFSQLHVRCDTEIFFHAVPSVLSLCSVLV